MAQAADGPTCRFRADGILDQTVSISVPPGAKTATVTAIVNGRPDKSGSVPYTRDQLTVLNAIIVTKHEEDNAAFRSAPDNQVECVINQIATAVKALDSRQD